MGEAVPVMEKRRVLEGSAEYVSVNDGYFCSGEKKDCLRENGPCLVRDDQRVRLDSSREALN